MALFFLGAAWIGVNVLFVAGAYLVARIRRPQPTVCEPDCVLCELAADWMTPAPIEVIA